MLMPFISNVWWFATSYLILLALSPFINLALRSCGEGAHLRLIIGMTVVWSLLPSLVNMPVLYSNVIWFVLLYTVAAFIRLHPEHFGRGAGSYALGAILIYVSIIALMYVVDVTGFDTDLWGVYSYIEAINTGNSVMVLVASLLLFLAFKSLEIPHSRTVNGLARTVFGVYLIHDFFLVRTWLYDCLFDCGSYTDSVWMLPYVLMVVASVFVACSAAEFIRIRIMDDIFLRNLPEHVLSLQRRYDGWVDRILHRKDTE